MRALYWAAVVNGVLAAPLMAVMMLIVRNPRVMGRLTLSRSMAIWGWGGNCRNGRGISCVFHSAIGFSKPPLPILLSH